MKRRSKVWAAPGKAQGLRAAKVKRPAPKRAAVSPTADEKDAIARLTRERDEALEQQAAASEVLRVISSSPADLQRVFEAMLDNAVRICDARGAGICRWDGEALHHVALKWAQLPFAELMMRTPIHPHPRTNVGRMLATKAVVHVPDLAAQPAYIEQREPGIVLPLRLVVHGRLCMSRC